MEETTDLQFRINCSQAAVEPRPEVADYASEPLLDNSLPRADPRPLRFQGLFRPFLQERLGNLGRGTLRQFHAKGSGGAG
jgi:hypothetical protein